MMGQRATLPSSLFVFVFFFNVCKAPLLWYHCEQPEWSLQTLLTDLTMQSLSPHSAAKLHLELSFPTASAEFPALRLNTVCVQRESKKTDDFV